MFRAVFVIILALVINLFPQFITTYSTESDPKTGSFAVTIGTSADEVCSGYQQTSDGGYIIATSMKIGGDTYPKAHLIKLDQRGIVEWNKGYEWPFSIDVKQKPDNGFILAYKFYEGGGGYDSGYLLTDSLGVEKKNEQSMCKEASYNVFNAVELTSDGGYIFPAWYDGHSVIASYVMKVGGSNNFKTWVGGEYNTSAAISVCQTADGGYICAGYGNLYKLNYLGAIEWSKYFANFVGRDIKMTTDGGYIIVGSIYIGEYPSGNNDIKLVKTDVDGNELWTKSFGGSYDDLGRTVDETSDGGYFITGNTKSFGAGGQDIWIIKTDVDGNKIWDKTIGGTADESVCSGEQTSDGGYVIGGTTASFGAGGSDIWIIKTDETGTLIEYNSVPLTTELYQNYPNPFNPDTKISFSIPSLQDVKLSVYNSNGQLVNELVNKKMNGGNHSFQFKGDDLNSGLYFYRLETGDKKLTKKMLLIK